MSPMQHKALWLFGGVVVLLTVASVVGGILKARAQTPARRDGIENLNARTRAWWGMIAVLAVAFLLGEVATLVMFGISSFFALREFITLTPTRPGDHRPLYLSFYVLIPVQYALIGYGNYGTAPATNAERYRCFLRDNNFRFVPAEDRHQIMRVLFDIFAGAAGQDGISLKEAKAEGYRPCSVCDPPQ